MSVIFKHIISKSHKFGYDCLIESVSKIKKLYPFSKSFVLYNNLENKTLDYLKYRLNKIVEFIDQNAYVNSLKIPPKYSAWKFYPPRIDLNSHEIILDNDIVIFKNSKFIERFLNNKDEIIITSAHKRFYGQFNKLIPKGIFINSGLFGFPPKYDFQKELDDFIEKKNLKEWKTHYCEEGLITYLMLKHGKYVIIGMDDICVLNKRLNKKKYSARCGYHFTGLNNGIDYYWLKWKTKIL